MQVNEYQCEKCELYYSLSADKSQCKSHSTNLIYRNCAMISSLACHSFEGIYQDWFLMHKNRMPGISDHLFLKELRKTTDQGNVTLAQFYQQIVLTRKENLNRVQMLGTGIKFRKTISSNVSSKCDLFVTDNEFYDHDQAALISGSVSTRSFFGSFAFKIFEKVERDPFFSDKTVCKKGKC